MPQNFSFVAVVTDTIRVYECQGELWLGSIAMTIHHLKDQVSSKFKCLDDHRSTCTFGQIKKYLCLG